MERERIAGDSGQGDGGRRMVLQLDVLCLQEIKARPEQVKDLISLGRTSSGIRRNNGYSACRSLAGRSLFDVRRNRLAGA